MTFYIEVCCGYTWRLGMSSYLIDNGLKRPEMAGNVQKWLEWPECMENG